jgi:hypothetical protein
MTVVNLIQTQQATGMLFTTVNGASVLYLIPPPLPTPSGPGGGVKTTNAVIAQLSATANEPIPQAPHDAGVGIEGGGTGFGYGVSASAATTTATSVHTIQSPPALAPCVSPTPADAPIITRGVCVLLSLMVKRFNGLVLEPVRLFRKYQFTQETKRILAETIPIVLKYSVDDIAAEVNAEHAVTPKNLRVIVCLKANNITKDLERNLASPSSQT